MTRAQLPTAVLLCACCLLAACSTAGSSGPAGSSRVIQVAAAENFWGSIAAQLGGGHVHVVSIITNPSTDPHSYEPTAADARTIAGARLVIENGIGYDPWAARLLAADQGQQTVLNVGDALGVPADGQSASVVQPGRRAGSDQQAGGRLQQARPGGHGLLRPPPGALRPPSACAKYDALIAAIKARYGGTPVGASERIFAMLAPALGLKLITPYSFPQGDQRGHRGRRPRTSRRSTARSGSI